MRDAALSIAKLYADTVYDCTPLPGGHNKVFAVKGDRDFILRLKKDRSDQDPAFGPGNVFGTVSSELDFMLYLKENGAPVAEPIAGKSGEYVYRRRYRNGDWIVSAFRLAPGKGFSDRFDGPEKLVQAGKALGLMHRLSKSYVPRGASSRRQWHLDPHLVKAPFLFSGFDNRLPEAFHRHMNQISRLNKSQDAFGLTHGDYLFSNYFFKEDEITVFDFDECAYSWFISDIAVCLYYYLIGAEPEKLSLRQKEAAAYLPASSGVTEPKMRWSSSR
jgi:Ser/Thr protein kinase RdoA (MazF antagonist)